MLPVRTAATQLSFLPTSTVHVGNVTWRAVAAAGATNTGLAEASGRPSPSSGPLVPATAEDWEAKKAIIEDLYLVQNIRVQDVATIMMMEHNFKATPRMYKQRFVKWKWQKYNRTGPGARKGASYTSSAISRPRSRANHHHGAVPTWKRLPFANDDVHDIHAAISCWEKYIWGWAVDPRWQTNTKFECLGGGEQSALAWINQDFRAAIEHFRGGDATGGGRLLRYGFMRLDDVLAADHVECLWICCVQIPQMLLDAGHYDILLVFLRHVQRVAAARLPAHHPLGPAARALRSLAERAPAQMRFYAERAGSVWIDIFKTLRGPDDAVTLSLRRAFLYVVPPSTEAVDSYIADLLSFVDDASDVFGRDHVFTVGKEIEAMYTRWLYKRRVDEDMLARVKVLLAKLDAWQTAKPESPEPSPPTLRVRGIGADYERAYAILALVPLYLGDRDAAEKARQRFLASAHLDRNIWMALCMELENVFRDAGLVDEAEEILRARLDEQVPKEVVEILDQEESEMAQSVEGPKST